MSPTTRTWAIRSGKAGNIARGIVFAIVGFFLAKAADEYDPDEAVGIDGALAKVQAQAWGTWLLAAVAIGLLGYAVFCLVRAAGAGSRPLAGRRAKLPASVPSVAPRAAVGHLQRHRAGRRNPALAAISPGA